MIIEATSNLHYEEGFSLNGYGNKSSKVMLSREYLEIKQDLKILSSFQHHQLIIHVVADAFYPRRGH